MLIHVRQLLIGLQGLVFADPVLIELEFLRVCWKEIPTVLVDLV